MQWKILFFKWFTWLELIEDAVAYMVSEISTLH